MKLINEFKVTSEDIAGEFGISASGARYGLRRVDFSYKKSLYLHRSKPRKAK